MVLSVSHSSAIDGDTGIVYVPYSVLMLYGLPILDRSIKGFTFDMKSVVGDALVSVGK